MSEKRRNNRNRILCEGKYQRTDGRYRFRCIDKDGKEKNVLSWHMDQNAPTPKGRRHKPSLREGEKQFQADLFDHIVTNGGNYTVLKPAEKYAPLKKGVRPGYKTVLTLLKKWFSARVRLSDTKNASMLHGSQRYQRNAEHLNPCAVWRYAARTAP